MPAEKKGKKHNRGASRKAKNTEKYYQSQYAHNKLVSILDGFGRKGSGLKQAEAWAKAHLETGVLLMILKRRKRVYP